MKNSSFVNINYCPLCGNKEIRKKHSIIHSSNKVIEKLKIKQINIFLYQCQKCGFHFISPQISPELMSKYYQILNSEYYDNNSNYEFQNSTSLILSLLKKYKPNGKVLEIGCGKGYLLKKLSDEGTYECVGIEPSPQASKYAVEHLGLTVKNELFGSKNSFNDLFDIVILVDVLEHLTFPLEIFININKVLKSGGIILASTGNIDSLNYKLYKKYWGYFGSWEHISFFNKKSITELCKLSHLELIKIKKYSYKRGPLKNIFTLIFNFIFLGKNILKYFLNNFFKKTFSYSLVKLTNDHFIVVIRKN